MSQILIRAQEPEDIPDITELLNQPQAVHGTLQTPYVSVAARRARFGSGRADHTALVAELEGKVIGTAGLTRHEGRRSHAGQIGMAVHDAYSGRGAGSALLAAVIEVADLWLGLVRIELTVWTDNRRAISLYERAGFEPEGVMRAYAWRDGAFVDALAMARLRP